MSISRTHVKKKIEFVKSVDIRGNTDGFLNAASTTCFVTICSATLMITRLSSATPALPRSRRYDGLERGSESFNVQPQPISNDEMIEEEELSMDRDTHATLYRTNVPEADSMRTDGRIEDLVRAFKVLPKATQREYSITVGEVKYGLDQINNFAREFGIKD